MSRAAQAARRRARGEGMFYGPRGASNVVNTFEFGPRVQPPPEQRDGGQR
jgi:hypothetical protein